MQRSSVVNGVITENVQLEYDKSETIVYSIGRKDHLLRKVTWTSGPANHKFKLIETHTHIRANPSFDPSLFVWKQAPGVKQVQKEAYWDPRLKEGADPFPFDAKDLNGEPVRLESFKGEVLLLDFWATWCGPCRRQRPFIRRAYDKFRDQGFEVVGISSDKTKAALTPFIASHRMKWRQIYDAKRTINKIYGVEAVPFSLLLGRDGKIVAVNPHSLLLEPAIRKALSRQNPERQ